MITYEITSLDAIFCLNDSTNGDNVVKKSPKALFDVEKLGKAWNK